MLRLCYLRFSRYVYFVCYYRLHLSVSDFVCCGTGGGRRDASGTHDSRRDGRARNAAAPLGTAPRRTIDNKTVSYALVQPSVTWGHRSARCTESSWTYLQLPSLYEHDSTSCRVQFVNFCSASIRSHCFCAFKFSWLYGEAHDMPCYSYGRRAVTRLNT